MDNIEFFNKFSLTFLEKLYDEFPEPINVDVRALGVSVLEEGLTEDEMYKLQSKAVHAINFLIDEGYIKVNNESTSLDDDFGEFKLTAKGLSALNRTLDSLTARESIISKVKATLANGVRSASTEAVSDLTRMLFSSATETFKQIVS